MTIEMDSQTDLATINWTPSTERYFIHLMLDQMQRGNRMGHTFNKQAWSDMLAMFNANFCFQYDVNVLKSHYNNLWKQYNDIKNLLEHSGFFWDATQQMVVADEYIWNAYIKACPDAQLYKNKTISNFNDLCFIYAYATADGRYSCSSHDMEFGDGIQGMNIGKHGAFASANHCLKKMCWTFSMDCYLVDLLQDEMLKGNKIGHAFTSEAWDGMVLSFNKKFGSHCDRIFLENRYFQLRSQYNNIKNLLEQKGFSWDDTHEMVTAEDYVWDLYTKAHPDARPYKNKSVPRYHKLCVIFGEETSKGGCSPLACSVESDGKGIYCQQNNDIPGPAWTPEMDRCFIDLLLKQVSKGDKIDCVLNSQVWTDIYASFSDNFGLEYDKESLKSRYRSLGNLFHYLKNLLNQKGFSWDETQQMVTAEADIWDAYIKEHPDAKSYRNLRTQNYNDLFLIYGSSSSGGGYHQPSQYVAFSGEANENNNWRTEWAPPMDRYFIDLMLDQVRKGCMVDQDFTEEAWDDMATSFSTEFGLLHDKDVLKSRFVDLRDCFSDMMILLDRNGFAWDEMHQMITATDVLWDNCIKEHPEAQSYCNRTLPSFNDFFLIYGNTNPNNGHNDPSHNVDDVGPIFGYNKGQEEDGLPSRGDLRMHWTRLMDHYFIKLMSEQVNKGNKIGLTFTKQGWAWIVASFNERFGVSCDKDQLEDRYLSFMEEHRRITDFLHQNGLFPKKTLQELISEDDIWESYIKENPASIRCRGRIRDSYNGWCRVFENRVPGKRCRTSGVKVRIGKISLEMANDSVFGVLQPVGNIEAFDPRKRQRSSVPEHSREVQNTSKKIREAIKNSGAVTVSFHNGKETDYSSIESIVSALQSVPDIDDELFLEACELLEDERKAKMFVAMDITARRKWLLKKLGR